MSGGDERPAVAGEVIELGRLISMANQIGDFFAPYPPERAREGLRNHLRTYWDPRMRSALLAHIDAGGDGLDERVVEGARLLRESEAEKERLLRAPTGLKQHVGGERSPYFPSFSRSSTVSISSSALKPSTQRRMQRLLAGGYGSLMIMGTLSRCRALIFEGLGEDQVPIRLAVSGACEHRE